MAETVQPSATFTIRLLGKMAVLRGDDAIALPRSKKTRALLAYLALASRPLTRDHLCTVFWDLPDDPRGSLRWSLSKLRGVLDEPERARLVADRERVAVERNGLEIDARALQEAVTRVEDTPTEILKRLAQAGSLLEGVSLPNCLDFETGLAEKRETVRQARIEVLGELLRRHADVPEQAIRHARLWNELDPLNPEACTGLIELLQKNGRSQEAEQQVELARTRLADAGVSVLVLDSAWSRLRASARDTVAEAVLTPAAETNSPDLGLDDEAYPPLPSQPSVAVLPFDTLSDASDRQVFADGLTHDIISRISRLRWLFVIARGSTFTFRDQAVDVQTVARRLGVRYVAQGNVRFAGDRIRVDAVLTDAMTRSELWADQFDRRLDDIFGIQDEISNAIVGALESEIERAEQQRALRGSPESLDAWSAYHRGLWHMHQFKREDFDLAENFFKRAIALDSNSPRPIAGLSFVHFQRAFLKLDPDYDGQIQCALELGEQAIALDARDATGHWAVGRALLMRREYEQSVDSLKTAIELNPNFASAQFSLSRSYFAEGSSDLGIQASDIARRLSPCDPLRFAMLSVKANCLAQMGRHAEAVDWVVRAARQPNAHHHILAIASYCTSLADRDDLAEDYLKRLRAVQPDYDADDFFQAFPIRQPEHIALIREGFQKAGIRA
ncbi:MAG: BTAD domain-containing putative transcriptional regulator [Methyloligellaceae bacterium]